MESSLAQWLVDFGSEAQALARELRAAGFRLSNGRVLDVPYHSQHDSDACRTSLDCGPACVEMLIKFYDPGNAVTTDGIMEFITGGQNRATSVRELQRAVRHFLPSHMLARYDRLTWDQLRDVVLVEFSPAIVLVRYGECKLRLDRNYVGGHWMVVVGFQKFGEIEHVVVHDPDFWGELRGQGAFLPLVRQHFINMWGRCHIDGNPNFLALVPEVAA